MCNLLLSPPSTSGGGLKSITSFVLYLESCVKCLCQACQIDTRKKKCRAWHFPLLMFSYRRCRPCMLAGVERLHKRSGWRSSDIQMLMKGEAEQSANHCLSRHPEKHACQAALTEGAQRNARDRIEAPSTGMIRVPVQDYLDLLLVFGFSVRAPASV